ncbi:hypothetical protein D6779_11445 [Candidatus Parcubacteria bacterium]|nr:MAG: hypothetical protein D6779_11445 [Candidatus Parcubacteria bacterium]
MSAGVQRHGQIIEDGWLGSSFVGRQHSPKVEEEHGEKQAHTPQEFQIQDASSCFRPCPTAPTFTN